MKTLSNISTLPNTSQISAQVRSVLTIVGIVIAIICSLVFLKEIYSSGIMGSPVRSMEVSKIVNVEMVVKAASNVLSLK
jgi:hypothetical protein